MQIVCGPSVRADAQLHSLYALHSTLSSNVHTLFVPCVQTYTYAIIPIREVCKARPISHVPGLEVGDHSSWDHAKSNPDRQVSMEDDSDIISYEVWGGSG